MKPSSKCYDLIKKWEGCYNKRNDGLIQAYLCPANVATIGWGSTHNYAENRAVALGDVIDQATADKWLEIEVNEKAAGVLSALGNVKANQNQFDALVSFAYNVGIGAFSSSTMLKKIKSGNMVGAADEFLRWVNAGGEVLEGLVNRRKDERALFLTPAEVVSKSVEERVTWFEVHRLESSGRTSVGVAAMAGADCLVVWDGTDKASLIQFLQRFPGANSLQVAPATKAWPTIMMDKPSQTGFTKTKLAAIAEAQCLEDISWRGNGLAKKYTKKFEGVFGTGRFSWCAAFVTWCVEQAGGMVLPVQTPGTEWTWALCEAWQQWAKGRGLWHDGTDGIARGDIVLFDWDGAEYPDTDWEDHIGIACGPLSGGGVVCAEGNTDDRTAIKTRDKSIIQGFVRLPEGFKL
jgi:GH24 family phage-related lysozyme (muramidase)